MNRIFTAVEDWEYFKRLLYAGKKKRLGNYNKPVLERERDAFVYQRIYNPSQVNDMIENARIIEYQDKTRPYSDPNKRPLFYSLDDAIKYIYKDQIK